MQEVRFLSEKLINQPTSKGVTGQGAQQVIRGVLPLH